MNESSPLPPDVLEMLRQYDTPTICNVIENHDLRRPSQDLRLHGPENQGPLPRDAPHGGLCVHRHLSFLGAASGSDSPLSRN